MSDAEILARIERLKSRVKDIVKKIQSLKRQMEQAEISLDDFRANKTVLEEELRDILQQIAQVREKADITVLPKAIKEIPPVIPKTIKKEIVEVTIPEQIKEDTSEIIQDDTSKIIDREISFASEAKDLMFYFQTEFEDSITNARVYLSITLEDHFIIGLDFSNFPERPILDIPSDILDYFDDNKEEFFRDIPTYSNWDYDNPKRIYELIQEIETVLIMIHQADIKTIEKKTVNYVKQVKRELQELIKDAKREVKKKRYAEAIETHIIIIDMANDIQDYELAEYYKYKLEELKAKFDKKTK